MATSRTTRATPSAAPTSKSRARRAPTLIAESDALALLERMADVVALLVQVGVEVGSGVSQGVPRGSRLSARLVALQHSLEALRVTAPVSRVAPMLRVRSTEASAKLRSALGAVEDTDLKPFAAKLALRAHAVVEYEQTVALLDAHARRRRSLGARRGHPPTYEALVSKLPSLRGYALSAPEVVHARAELKKLDLRASTGKVPTAGAALSIVSKALGVDTIVLRGMLDGDTRERSGRSRDRHRDP